MRAGPYAVGLAVLAACGESTTPSQPVVPDLPPAVASVEISPQPTGLRRGQTVQLTATVKDASGRTITGRTVTWSSGQDSILSVSASGLVLARGLGATVITASSEGRSAQLPVSVTPVPVESLRITPDSARLSVGLTLQYEVTVVDSTGAVVTDRPVQWTSSDTTLATISSNGLVTSRAVGVVTIGASLEGRSGQSPLDIHPAPVATITVLPPAASIKVGETVALSAVLRDAAGDTLSDRAVEWSSSDSGKADVSELGVVRGISAGSAVVTARSEGASATATVTVTPLPVGISTADSVSLTFHLDRIAATTAWVQASVDTANAILLQGQYSDAQWRSFFTAYFASRPFTAPLSYYLSHPIFYWFGDAVNRRLQAAIAPVATTQVRGILAKYGNGLADELHRNPLLTGTLSSFLGMLSSLAELGTQQSVRSEANILAEGLVRDFPGLLLGPVSDERAIRNMVEFVWMRIVLAEPLSPTRKSTVASLLNLSPGQIQILDRYGVLVYDRFSIVAPPAPTQHGRLNATQLQIIESLLRLTPAGLHDLRAITVLDAFGLFPNVYHCCFYGRYRNQSIISISELALGPLENAFPLDIAARETPLFSTILVHELNHVVDNLLYTNDPRYRQRRDALIAAAGKDSINYLRSMITSGFFSTHPVELFSSTSQQWLADSEHTLRLGRQRFDQGRPEPLNQALWFAEVYAAGGSTVPLYRMTDPAGALTRTDAPLTRNAEGHITSLVVGDSIYAFVRRPNGDVASYTLRSNR